MENGKDMEIIVAKVWEKCQNCGYKNKALSEIVKFRILENRNWQRHGMMLLYFETFSNNFQQN